MIYPGRKHILWFDYGESDLDATPGEQIGQHAKQSKISNVQFNFFAAGVFALCERFYAADKCFGRLIQLIVNHLADVAHQGAERAGEDVGDALSQVTDLRPQGLDEGQQLRRERVGTVLVDAAFEAVQERVDLAGRSPASTRGRIGLRSRSSRCAAPRDT